MKSWWQKSLPKVKLKPSDLRKREIRNLVQVETTKNDLDLFL
jgi:hypothetical protein